MLLNNCPFCGSISVKLVINQPYDRVMTAYVKCNSCHARGSRITHERADLIAVARWNHEPVEFKENINKNQTTLLDQIGD